MKTKYFNINEGKQNFLPSRYPDTLKEAWEKTFEKWGLISMGYKPWNVVSTCGLCNLFYSSGELDFCESCPIALNTGKKFCNKTPINGFFSEGVIDFEKALEVIKFLYTVKNNCGGKQ